MIIIFDNTIHATVLKELMDGAYVEVIDEVNKQGKRNFANTDKYGSTAFIENERIYDNPVIRGIPIGAQMLSEIQNQKPIL